MEYKIDCEKLDFNALVLWGSGWKRRNWKTNGQAFTPWSDPPSGLRYGPKVAIKIFETQALDQLKLK